MCKVLSRVVTGYLRFLNTVNYCTVEALVVVWRRERNATQRGVVETQTKLASTLKQVERILCALAKALIVPLREHKKWQFSVTLRIWTATVSTQTSRKCQCEILEDYQSSLVFTWQGHKQCRDFLCYSWQERAVRPIKGSENTQYQDILCPDIRCIFQQDVSLVSNGSGKETVFRFLHKSHWELFSSQLYEKRGRSWTTQYITNLLWGFIINMCTLHITKDCDNSTLFHVPDIHTLMALSWWWLLNCSPFGVYVCQELYEFGLDLRLDNSVWDL